MDRPDFPQPLHAALVTVLRRRGVPPGEIEAIGRALAASRAPDTVIAILEARHPEHAAWMAPMDGVLIEHAGGYLLTKEPELGGSYAPSDHRIQGGGVLCWSEDGAYRSAFRYGPLDGRALQRAAGSAVEAGDALTDGALDPHDVHEILGEAATLAMLRDRVARLADIDPAVAESIVTPLFDIVEIDEPHGGRLRKGSRVTRQRLQLEIGRVLGRTLAGLPADADPRLAALARMKDSERAEGYYADGMYEAVRDSGRSFDPPVARPVLVGYPELATLDDGGRLAGPGTTFHLGTFEVTGGTLRASDPAHYRASAGKNDLPAVVGTWRAESIVETLGPWGPRVTQLRAWADRLAPDLDDAVEDAGFWVGVDSGLAGFFDVGERSEREATRETFSETCFELSRAGGPAQAAIVKGLGVVALSGLGDGGYRCTVLQDEDGSVIAVSLDFRP